MILKKLSDKFLTAWHHTILEYARLNVQEASTTDRTQLLKTIARREKATLLEMRAIFTEERDALSSRLLNSREYLVAYLLGFHIPNAFRLLQVLKRVEHQWRGLFGKDTEMAQSTLALWDFGCGTGALSQFIAETYAPSFQACRVYLYDTNAILLSAAETFFKKLELPNTKLFRRKVPLQDLNTEPFVSPDHINVVSIGYVWNELQKNPRAQEKIHSFCKGLLERKAKVLLIVLEPAQEFSARLAMSLRDDFTKSGFVPLYPCPHKQACPMLERKEDRCYSEFPLKYFPQDARFVDEMLDIQRTNLASAAYVFASPTLYADMTARRALQPIVVGRPKNKEDRGFTYLMCTPKASLAKGTQVKISSMNPIFRGEGQSSIEEGEKC